MKEAKSSGDTIFIRNLSFDTTQETLKEFIVENFGEVAYCLVCKDKETGESKGTAFVKFKDPENASKCLEEFRDRELMTKFHIDGRNIIVLPALSRDEVQEIKQTSKETKDKRNLNLSKEGYIRPASDEAKDVSKSDMEKRNVLELRKREKLKNLHNFVSDVRLCVHNLPPTVDDTKLRKICLNSVQVDNPKTVPKIVECRVMRNKQRDGKLGKSKGFAFVAFSKHEHALAALRNLNNNPNTFSKDHRPIVEFSIENLVAINKKKTRAARSKIKQAQSKENKKVSVKKVTKTGKKKADQKKADQKKVDQKKVDKQKDKQKKKIKQKT